MTSHHRMPQCLHLLPKGARTRFVCGQTEGAYARVTERAWLRRFLKLGGKICPDCDKGQVSR